MSLITRNSQPDPDTPGALAAEHDRARAEYEARRRNVIERAVKRQESLVAHRKEIDAEIAAHSDLLTRIPQS